MSTGDEIHFDPPAWSNAGAQNGPAPVIAPAQVAGVRSAIDQLLAALGIASNSGIPADNLDAATDQAARDIGITDAQGNFPANDQQSAQLLQSLPQLLAGAAGAFGGALTGALQPFAQLAQQGAQAAQQGLQAALGAAQQAATSSDGIDDDLPDDLDDTATGWDDGAGGGAGEGGVGGFGETAPASTLGPPPTPSAATYPASAPPTPAGPPSQPSPSAMSRTPMGPMPMMPPGAVGGNGPSNDTKPDTKRIMAPTVRNGAPVQGRITTPPPAPVVTKHVQGKPVATRRILVPEPDEPQR